MLIPRVVPVLLTDGVGLVKTTRYRKPRYVGDPTNVVRIFNEKEVDELILLDIQATRQQRAPSFGLVERLAAECFMPLAYGGGVADAKQARRLFSLGVEKVVVRAAGLLNPGVISAIADVAGSQSVAAAIDITRDRLGRLRLHLPGTRLHGDRDWLGRVDQLKAAGAGELVLSCVHRDGLMTGMDLPSITLASSAVDTPLLAIGGVGALSHIREGLLAGASAVGGGSFFVFSGPRRAVLISYPTRGELNALEAHVQ